MSIGNIVGRREEISRLDRCMEDASAQLVIVYGRRRVGKTYLINEYYDNKVPFNALTLCDNVSLKNIM